MELIRISFWTLIILGLSMAMMAARQNQNRLPPDQSVSRRMERSLHCPPNEYLHNGLCCINCPAGTHVSSHCTVNHRRGSCSPCTPGKDFTAAPNGMEDCLTCRPCRFHDQVQVGECTQTRNNQCECKPNTFCIDACHLLCHDCSRCPEGQSVKQNCTPSSDTVCEGTHSGHPTVKEGPFNSQRLDGSGVALIVLGFVCICAAAFFIYWKQKGTKKQTGIGDADYQRTAFEDSPEAVQIIPVMTLPIQEQVGSLGAQINVKHDQVLTDDEWLKCYNCLKEAVPPSRWKEMMRHLGLSNVDIEHIGMDNNDSREKNYQMFLWWRNQNGQSASMTKVFQVLDKMNLCGCKENFINGLKREGIYIA